VVCVATVVVELAGAPVVEVDLVVVTLEVTLVVVEVFSDWLQPVRKTPTAMMPTREIIKSFFIIDTFLLLESVIILNWLLNSIFLFSLRTTSFNPNIHTH